MPSDAQTIEAPAQTRLSGPPKTIPGPPVRFRDLVSFLAFGSPRDLLSFYMDTARQYGDIVHFGRGSYSSYFVVHPDYVKHVLQDKVRNYPKKNRFNDMLKPLTGEGLLTSDGEVWRRRRRLSQPAFHHERLAGFATGMTDATQAMLARWAPLAKRGQALDISQEMQRVTLSIVGRALFSADIGADSDEMGRAVTRIFEHFNHRLRHPLSWPESVPTPRNRRFHTAIATIDSVSYRLIAEHRKADIDSGDLLSMLIAARDEETGQGLNDRQIRDEVGTFLGAGHETTAVTLAWVWYLLSKHPHVE
ncbi:MAG: cytochrome P450, partial [Desulfurellaceae bacterium]|nr:cytochrome P450 [Desulfurellaceae bacterium]